MTRPPIPTALLTQLAAHAAVIRGAGDDSKAWDAASEEFDRLMTTAVKIDLVMEVVALRLQSGGEVTVTHADAVATVETIVLDEIIKKSRGKVVMACDFEALTNAIVENIKYLINAADEAGR